MSRLIAAAIGLAGIVFAILFLIWALQRKLIYFPSGQPPSPEAVGLPEAQNVMFPTADGLALNAWWLTPSTKPWFTVVVFSGNAGSRAHRAPLARALAREGIAVLLTDYRGFGGNPGAPSETGLKDDARAARQYLLTRSDVDPTRVAYFGESLGSGVAVGLAAEWPPAALVLRSPFTSVAELGQLHYPILPVRWLLRDRFASIERIAELRSPLLIIAGDRDRIVPISMSQRLYDAANQPKTLVIISGADHNDDALWEGKEMIASIVSFLKATDAAAL